MNEQHKSNETHASTEKHVAEIAKQAHEQISWLAKAFKAAAYTIGAIVAVGMFLSYRSISDMKTEMGERAHVFQDQLVLDSESAVKTMKQDLTDEVRLIRETVVNRVREEFEEKNIHDLVAREAQARIKAIADEFIEVEIAKQMLIFRNDLTALVSKSSEDFRKRTEEIDKKIAASNDAEQQLTKMLESTRLISEQNQIETSFFLDVIASQNDDRYAFWRLQSMAKDELSPLHTEAETAVESIKKQYFYPDGGRNFPTTHWENAQNTSLANHNQILQFWHDVDPQYERSYVEFVWTHDKLTKEQKLSFLYKVLREDQGSLQAADFAARKLAKEAGIETYDPFELADIHKWWAGKYPGWSDSDRFGPALPRWSHGKHRGPPPASNKTTGVRP